MANELNFEEVVFGDNQEESSHLEIPLSRQTFLLVALAAVLVGSIALGRSLFLNIIRGDFYTNRAFANANREVDLPAPRGVIFDRFGKPLVENKNSFSVFVNASEIIRSPEGSEKALEILSGILKDFDKEKLRHQFLSVRLEQRNWLPVARNISLAEAINIRSLNSPAIQIADDYIRSYPDGPVFSHILGYAGASDVDNEIVGKSGVESQYNDVLKGNDGLLLIYRDAGGNELDRKVAEAPISGASVTITIDAELQKYFYNRLKQNLTALGSKAGVGIAINPQNGEVLSLVSLPSFDNNKVADYLKGGSQPLFNRAISGIYTPGSTIKPLVALAALHEKIVEPADSVLSIGFIEVPNPYNPEAPSRFLDWKAHGWVDLHSALAKSSNVYFYAIGGGLPRSEMDLASGQNFLKGLGIENLNKYWQEFLLGQKTGIDLPSEGDGFLPDPEEKEARTGQIWRIGDTYNVSIGQGDLLLTPLQLINFISSIANGGRIYRPHVLSGQEPQVLMDYSAWQEELNEVREGMADAVRKPYGTASSLSYLPFPAAGKTGSSQVSNNTKTNAFFVGYAPRENPEIAVLVLVENSKEGSLNAVPIAKDVFEWYYQNRLVQNQ